MVFVGGVFNAGFRQGSTGLDRAPAHIGRFAEGPQVIGVAAAAAQARELEAGTEFRLGGPGRRFGRGQHAFLEGPCPDLGRFLQRHGLRVKRTGLGGFAAVQGVVDGGPGGAAAQAEGKGAPEEGEAAGNRRRGYQGRRCEGIRGGKLVPAVVRRLRKAESQRASGHDFLVGEVVPFNGFSVQGDIGNVGPLGVVGRNDKAVAVAQRDGAFPEQRGGQDVFSRAGTGGVQADGGEHVPGAHLAAVLVAANTVGGGAVHFLQQLPHRLLALGGFFQPVVQPGHVVAGLVAVGILSLEAGDVGHLHLPAARLIAEEGVQGGHHGFAPAHQGRVAGYVVRHKETGLPGNGLRVVPRGGKGVEGLHPVAVGSPSAHEAGDGVKDMPIAEGPGIVFGGHVGLPQALRHAGDAPVVVGEFQRLGHGFALQVGRNVSVLVIQGRCIAFVLVGRHHHGLQGQFPVKTADAAEPGVGNHGNAVIANHAAGFSVGQGPDGEFSPKAVHFQHTANHAVHQARVQQGLQRIPAAEGVPEGKGGIEGFLAVVGNVVGAHQRMVQAGVELLRGAAFHHDAAQGAVPAFGGKGQHRVKVFFFGLSVCLCRPGRREGDTRPDGELLGLVREGEEEFAFFRLFHAAEGNGESRVQEALASLYPGVDNTLSGNFPVTFGLQAVLYGLAAFTDTVDGVYQ